MRQTTTFTSEISDETRKRVDRLFLKFAAMYGQLWRSQFKNDAFLALAKSEWQKGLAGFTEDIFELAIDMCRNTRELPPTLPQFIDFCKKLSKRDVFSKPRELPEITSFEVGEAHLLDIKKLLNISTSPRNEC